MGDWALHPTHYLVPVLLWPLEAKEKALAAMGSVGNRKPKARGKEREKQREQKTKTNKQQIKENKTTTKNH